MVPYISDMRKFRIVVGALFAGAIALGATAAHAHQHAGPIVIELFTSQGCNSCPAADAFLEELAQRDNILALSFHVNYWDYLGWKDTFATEWTTQRQRTYAVFLGERTIYTPQMVIGGLDHVVGSRRAKVQSAIDTARDPYLELRATYAGDGKLAVTIPEGEMNLRDVVVWLVRFDKSSEVAIERGENAGQNFIYHNVVRDYREVAMWTGSRMDIEFDLSELRDGGRDGAAVLVQEGGSGRIIGAIEIDLDAI